MALEMGGNNPAVVMADCHLKQAVLECARALGEIRRVLKPGGHIAIHESTWRSALAEEEKAVEEAGVTDKNKRPDLKDQLIVISLLLSVLLPVSLPATPDYAEDTKQGCLICHLEEVRTAYEIFGCEGSLNVCICDLEGVGYALYMST